MTYLISIIIFFLSISISHATDLKKIVDNNMSDSAEAALNINFEKINNVLDKCVLTTSTQTINGYKSFDKNVAVTGSISATNASIPYVSVDTITVSSGGNLTINNTAGSAIMVLTQSGLLNIGSDVPTDTLSVASGYLKTPNIKLPNTTTPSNSTTTSGQGGICFVGGEIVLWYNNGGTMKYIHCDVNSQSTTWQAGPP